MCRASWLWPLLLLGLLLMTMSMPARSGDDQVLVIGDTTRPYVVDFIRALRQSAAQSSLSVVTSDVKRTDNLQNLQGYRCVVTVGNEAARHFAGQSYNVPILHALVTDALAQELSGESSPQAGRGFLLVEQPVSRLLQLAILAMPERKRLGVIYGPVSLRSQGDMQRQAGSMGAMLVERQIRDEQQLSGTLDFFTENADLLITLPDPVVVNEGSIKTLMLGAYHGNLPLLGYSQAMVKAGALMAIHTTPEQFGRYSGELIASGFWNNPNPSGVRFQPRYFEVSVNYQVARALAIDLPNEDELEARIRTAEQGR